MGYERGDPVCVRLPFEFEGESVVCEGKVVRVLPNDLLRVVFSKPRELNGFTIEQVLIDPKHLI